MEVSLVLTFFLSWWIFYIDKRQKIAILRSKIKKEEHACCWTYWFFLVDW